MRQLYVCSPALPDKTDNDKRKHRLIGILSELVPAQSDFTPGEYMFMYHIGGTFEPAGAKGNYCSCLRISEFDDPTGCYRGKSVYGNLVHKFMPHPPGETRYTQNAYRESLASAGLTEYDEWELLKHYGKNDMHRQTYLFEELPEEVILYEQL